MGLAQKQGYVVPSGFILLMIFLLNQKYKIGSPKLHKLTQKPSNFESLEVTAEKKV